MLKSKGPVSKIVPTFSLYLLPFSLIFYCPRECITVIDRKRGNIFFNDQPRWLKWGWTRVKNRTQGFVVRLIYETKRRSNSARSISHFVRRCVTDTALNRHGYHTGRIDWETDNWSSGPRPVLATRGGATRFLTEDPCTCPRKQLVRSNALYFFSSWFRDRFFGLFRNRGGNVLALAFRPEFDRQNLEKFWVFEIRRLASKISSNRCVEMILLPPCTFSGKSRQLNHQAGR